MEGREAKAEDWCFVCKDGGDLILCNNGNCSKVYHLDCLGFHSDSDCDGETAFQIEEDWTCDCHSCSSCEEASEVHCFCCPTSFCKNCIESVKFIPLRPNKGLCTECWTLVRLAEKLSFSKKAVDFEDRDTHECLFKEYWEIVKEEEGLTRGDLVAVEEACSSKKSRKKMTDTTPTPVAKTLQDRDTKKFVGWGSKPLIEFLTSFGVDSTKQLSPSEVSSIILKYVQENDLIHPINKKKVICDGPLHLIFKKNTVAMKHINLLLGPHLFHANEANNGIISKKRSRLEPDQPQINGDVALNKHHRTLSGSEDKPTFASLVPHNIKLVYLTRSLVEDLLKQLESFEDKVVGSFVMVIDTNSSQLHSKGKISQQLLQVTAVSTGGTGIVLHFCGLPNIQISMLSDSDLTEEDCMDLKERIAKGLHQRPTVRMVRELDKLQNLIDRANEKGRRNELYQLIEQRQRLKNEAEQPLPLLKQLPGVIADSTDAPLNFTLVRIKTN
ncbi:zinc finger CCCH domain-containing protein 44-like isoform X2 [Benincasa hispida]|uniref:zinc finger CCCH domain-containing protein 44-like isoform X2 n=1 Tax=Benincasa hispida TaxID=102211 RepID=UPI001900C418|nr:zinc finger CCCH domain-containing protein 44-like isoform X2 [Benincasa hispida]